MSETPIQSRYVVYLLHFDAQVGSARHYLGICKAQRLHRRQMQHAAGNGAALTREACRLGIGWTVVRLYPTDTPALEKRLKRSGHFADRCPICSPGLFREATEDFSERRYTPTKRPARVTLGWPEEDASTRLDHPRTKGGPTGAAPRPFLVRP